LKKKDLSNAFYLCTDGCATISKKDGSDGPTFYLTVCIENNKWKSGNSYISGQTAGFKYDHKSGWVVSKSSFGFFVKAEGTIEHYIPYLGVHLFTEKVTLRSTNFDPCTGTGTLIIFTESDE